MCHRTGRGQREVWDPSRGSPRASSLSGQHPPGQLPAYSRDGPCGPIADIFPPRPGMDVVGTQPLVTLCPTFLCNKYLRKKERTP